MPDHPLCPPHNLPPTPCEDFFYCPDPSQLTPEQLDALFPLEQRIAFIRDVYREAAALAPNPHNPSTLAAPARGKAHVNAT